MKQRIIWDKQMKKPSLVTKKGNKITSEPLTIKQASQWTAENKF